jgi:hypothetical protein
VYQFHFDELTRPQQVHPESQNGGQLLPRLILKVVVEHGFKAIQARKHGEKQCIQITCHHVPIDGAQHGDIRIVVLQFAFEGFVGEYEEVVSLVEVVGIPRNGIFGLFGS